MSAPRGVAVVLVALLVPAAVSAAVSPGRADASATWPVSAGLVLAEAVTGGVSASDEYVEIYNAGTVATDLGGCELVYVTASGATVTRKAAFDSPLVLAPGAHLLVANSAGAYAALADATYSGGLAADGGSLALRHVGGAVIDALSWGTAGNAYVEGAVAPAPPARSSLERRPGGAAGNWVDTNDNASDWVVQSNPVPQSLASTPVPGPASPPPAETATPTSISPLPPIDTCEPPSSEPTIEPSAGPRRSQPGAQRRTHDRTIGRADARTHGRTHGRADALRRRRRPPSLPSISSPWRPLGPRSSDRLVHLAGVDHGGARALSEPTTCSRSPTRRAGSSSASLRRSTASRSAGPSTSSACWRRPMDSSRSASWSGSRSGRSARLPRRSPPRCRKSGSGWRAPWSRWRAPSTRSPWTARGSSSRSATSRPSCASWRIRLPASPRRT